MRFAVSRWVRRGLLAVSLACVPSPILYDGYVYLMTDKGLLTCLDARTGDVKYEGGRPPVAASFMASPVAVAGKLLIMSQDGDTFVIKAGPAHEVVRTNPLGEPISASAAVSQGRIYIRGERQLFAIGAGSQESALQQRRQRDLGPRERLPSACSWKALLSIPGTWASVVSSMRVMPNPSPTFSRWTRAAVWMRVGGWPALVRPAERAMEKQPAWAAAISSSGFVPLPSSKRDANE